MVSYPSTRFRLKTQLGRARLSSFCSLKFPLIGQNPVTTGPSRLMMNIARFVRVATLSGVAILIQSTLLTTDAFPVHHARNNRLRKMQAATRSDPLSESPAILEAMKRKRSCNRPLDNTLALSTSKENLVGTADVHEVIFKSQRIDPRTHATVEALDSSSLSRQKKDEAVAQRHEKRLLSKNVRSLQKSNVVTIPQRSSIQRTDVSVRTKPCVAAPWNAPYQVSMTTQAMLKDTAARVAGQSDEERSRAILRALLNTPPDLVNEANIVCTLTLSAKCMTETMKLTLEHRRLLFEVFDILKIVVDRGQLGARQLCNAVYAIAKHYNKDPLILPAPPMSTAMLSKDMLGVAEAWVLQDEDDDTPQRRLESTIETIAGILTTKLEDARKHGPRKPTVGEVSMACWAYGVLKQRVRPPGWVVPPQLSRLPSRNRKDHTRKVQWVTFEQWAVISDGNETVSMMNPVGFLFDAIGDYLCEERLVSGSVEVLVQHMSWSEMANVAWAFSNHGHCRSKSSERLMATLAEEATCRMLSAVDEHSVSSSVFLPRDISQLVWSIGTLQSDNFRLGEDLAKLIDATASHYLQRKSHADRPLETWSSADLVQLAIALAHGRIDHLPLLRALYDEAAVRISCDLDESMKRSSHISNNSFFAWEVGVLLWVQARLYLKENQGAEFGAFLKLSTRWIAEKAQGLTSLEEIGIGAQEQANLAWSLTVLEAYLSPDVLHLFKAIFRETSKSCTKNEFIQLAHAHQLWQALYLLEYEWPEAVEQVPSWFRDFLKEKWSAEKARQKISSARHRTLSKTLNLMGVAHFNEHDEDIDVAIVLKDQSLWTSAAKKADHNYSHFKVGKFVVNCLSRALSC